MAKSRAKLARCLTFDAAVAGKICSMIKRKADGLMSQNFFKMMSMSGKVWHLEVAIDVSDA